MGDELLQETAAALKSDWDLVLPDTLTEEAILRILADRVVAYLERGAEAFFQLMYRLDIAEHKLNAAMLQEDVPTSIARLIYNRQLQKIQSRHEHRMKQENDDPELRW